ncbi:TPA: hypothetical protein N3A33_002840 [Salmonella enterica subsp. salamae serovar 28:r:e,n,z15]|nr:hypothetical protein [Salmonella enterica subsp. salamae serovar 28:r:e,n,z15]
MKLSLTISLTLSALLLTGLANKASAGCGFMISPSQSSLNETGNVTLTPAADPQALMPSQTDLLTQKQTTSVAYWGRNQNTVSKTIFFSTKGTAFTADPNNAKGWLVDSAVPGLYFILSVDMVNPDGTVWGNFSPAMPIYLSNDKSINQSAPVNGAWGCAGAKNDTFFDSASMTFNLSFYTTGAFNPAQAAGKQILVGSKLAGVVDNTQNSGGQFNVYLAGPLTIATASCGAFSAAEKVELGSIPMTSLTANPDDVYNKTPFQITLQNCYAKPTLVVNLSANPVKNNLLTNTKGTAGGVGVGLEYTTESNTSQRLDLTQAVTIGANNLHYTSDSGNGILNMSAFLGVTDKSTLSAGSVDIPAVITLTNP